MFYFIKGEIGNKEAEALVQYVKSYSSEEIRQSIQNPATRKFVKDEMTNLFKSEIIKWMFVF